MNKFFFSSAMMSVLLIAKPDGLADDNPIDHWATAVGGRDKVAAIKAVYREPSLEFGAYKGTLKVWHTADGKYRKEEKIGDLSTVEIFDGTKGTIKEGDAPAIPGLPPALQPLRRGLNVFAAAQAYYHRPGDWKEMPNFFNPLWGARLVPVLETNVAAKLGLTGVPALRQLLLH